MSMLYEFLLIKYNENLPFPLPINQILSLTNFRKSESKKSEIRNPKADIGSRKKNGNRKSEKTEEFG